MDEIEYSNYNIQACMVILVIMMVLLLSIMAEDGGVGKSDLQHASVFCFAGGRKEMKRFS